jgi:hypothetical protein
MTTKGCFVSYDLPPKEYVADKGLLIVQKRLKYIYRECDTVIKYPVGSGGLPVVAEDKGAIAKWFVTSTALSLTTTISSCLYHPTHAHGNDQCEF